MKRCLRNILTGMALAGCLLAGSPSLAVGPLHFNPVTSVMEENLVPGNYQLTIEGKTSDGVVSNFTMKKANFSNPAHKAIMDFCEKAALIAMNNPTRYRFTIFGQIFMDGYIYTIDLSENDRVSCKLYPRN